VEWNVAIGILGSHIRPFFTISRTMPMLPLNAAAAIHVCPVGMQALGQGQFVILDGFQELLI